MPHAANAAQSLAAEGVPLDAQEAQAEQAEAGAPLQPWGQTKQRAPESNSAFEFEAYAESDPQGRRFDNGESDAPPHADGLDEGDEGEEGDRDGESDDELDDEFEPDAEADEAERASLRDRERQAAKARAQAAKDKTWTALFARWPSPDATPEAESLPPVWRLWLRNGASAPGRAAFFDAIARLSVAEREKLGKMGLAEGTLWLWAPSARKAIDGLDSAPISPRSPPSSPVCALAALVAFAAAAGQAPAWAGAGAALALAVAAGPAIAQSISESARIKKERAQTASSGELSQALGQWGDEGAALILARGDEPSSAEAAQWAPDGWGQSGELSGRWATGEAADVAQALREERPAESGLRLAIEGGRRGASSEQVGQAWLKKGDARARALGQLAWPGLRAQESAAFLVATAIAAGAFAFAALAHGWPDSEHVAAGVGVVAILGACAALGTAGGRIRRAMQALGGRGNGARKPRGRSRR